MGYLICEKCLGHYKLQLGESPEDFEKECDCGGKLVYKETLESVVDQINISKTTITSGTPLNKVWYKYSNYFVDLYNRNKMILAVSIVVYVGSFIIGNFVGYFSSGFIQNLLKMQQETLLKNGFKITTFTIFTHNFQSLLLTYIGGLIVIIPAIVLFINGLMYGAFLGYLIHLSGVNPSSSYNAGTLIIYTLPHGIFEIPGLIISGTAGFRLATLFGGIIKSKRMKTPINQQYWKFKDSLVLLTIAVCLTFIAAIIEANYTIPIGNYISANLHIPLSSIISANG